MNKYCGSNLNRRERRKRRTGIEAERLAALRAWRSGWGQKNGQLGAWVIVLDGTSLSSFPDGMRVDGLGSSHLCSVTGGGAA